MNTAYLWYISWAAIPLILSIALFWLTDSKAFIGSKENQSKSNINSGESLFSKIISSPFGGLGIKITGSAALFFIIFVMMNPIETGFYEKQSDWKMQIDFKDAATGRQIPTNKFIKAEIIPDLIQAQTADHKSLLITLSGLREDGNNLIIPYSVRFQFEGYETEAIQLPDSINSKIFCNRNTAAKYLYVKTRLLTQRYSEAIPTPLTNDTNIVVTERIIPKSQ
jgi:hypothetical protein